MDEATTTTRKPEGAAPHLIPFILMLSIFWIACFLFERDGFSYLISAIAAIGLTLRHQAWRSTTMPKWLSVSLWIPAGAFLLLLAFIALRH